MNILYLRLKCKDSLWQNYNSGLTSLDQGNFLVAAKAFLLPEMSRGLLVEAEGVCCCWFFPLFCT